MKRVAENEDSIIAAEKWLVSFRKNGKSFMRQFRAAGYYEAYDTVLTYAERRKAEVLWFREKRNCGQHLNRNHEELESLCTYCHAHFNEQEPVPCNNERCNAIFCSRECMQEHYRFRHERLKA